MSVRDSKKSDVNDPDKVQAAPQGSLDFILPRYLGALGPRLLVPGHMLRRLHPAEVPYQGRTLSYHELLSPFFVLSVSFGVSVVYRAVERAEAGKGIKIPPLTQDTYLMIRRKIYLDLNARGCRFEGGQERAPLPGALASAAAVRTS